MSDIVVENAVVSPRGKRSHTVGELYKRIKDMTILYDFMPGERINEVEVSNRFGVSRAPLREALNRLAAENLLHFVPNKGYFTKKLSRQEVFDLYQLREIIELGGLRLAIKRATEKEISDLSAFWDSVMERTDELNAKELVTLDEEFHIRLMRLSGNVELARSLNAVNERIRFVRWIDLKREQTTYSEHRSIVESLAKRDARQCEDLLSKHISRRMEEITLILRESVAQLYVR